MQFKNLQIILIFVTFASFVFSSPIKNNTETYIQHLKATEEVQSIDNVLKYTEFRGDDKVDEFLESGGTDSDNDVIHFVLNKMGYNITNVFFNNMEMACSAFQTLNENGNGYYFGRNLDWMSSEPLVLVNHPDNGYSSISTVNTRYISWFSENIPLNELIEKEMTNPEDMITFPDELIRLISLFFPLDGVNEKGLSISINMVYNGTMEQNSPGLPNITALPLIRVLLNKAANVDEAIEIIKNVNLHGTLKQDFHYLISDATGKSVTVEYINNEIEVTDTKIITNFYISDKVEYFEYSHDRYDIVKQMMDKYPNMTIQNAMDTLEAVTFEGDTQWSVVYDQLNLEATYSIKSNFEKGYHIKLFEDIDSDDDTLVVTDTEDLIAEEDSDSDDETETDAM